MTADEKLGRLSKLFTTERVLAISPQRLCRSACPLVLILFLCGTKDVQPGELIWQEGVAYRQEGRELQAVGDLQRAVAAYRRAIMVKPDYAEAYNDLGVALESLGKLGRAEDAYKMALKLQPTLGPAHTNLALLYEETNRVKEAADHWGARIRLGPLEDRWVVRAREKLAKYNLPVPELPEETVAKRREEARKAVRAARAHMDAARWDKAQQELERALKADPGNAEARKLLKTVERRAAQAQARGARELEAAKGRVGREYEAARRAELARRAEAERTKDLAKHLREVEETRRKAAEAERKAAAGASGGAAPRPRAQAAESKRLIEAAKRIEAEKRAEEIKKRAVAGRVVAAPSAPAAAPEAVTTPANALARPGSSVASQAGAVAQEFAREKSKVRGQSSHELYKRAQAAMRDGEYPEASDLFRQILLLDPNHRDARQGLERAQKALIRSQAR